MSDIFLAATLVSVLLVIVLQIFILRKPQGGLDAAIAPRLDNFEKLLEKSERTLRDEEAKGREEFNKSSSAQRQELIASFKEFGDSVVSRMKEVESGQKSQLVTFSTELNSFSKISEDRLDKARTDAAENAKNLREEVVNTLNKLSETISTTLSVNANTQKCQLETLATSFSRLSETNEKKLEEVRTTVEAKLKHIQDDNSEKLEKMRQTVDEKLQGTLEKRLGESFKQVSERLEQVHKGLGEMQTLATGVGDLKKVLTNVKTRGTWGEVQLGTLLDQVLTREQYDSNVSVKGTGERVEFAIKLPGQGEDKDDIVWLPIDAKFPIEDYYRLVEAQERADIEAVENAGKLLETRVKGCARDICEKYIHPPKSTDFGVLFLPIEGLFAEVIRRPGLAESIQRDFRVVIAGPTTLWSILNSLQMGFRTLAIQKRSSEVWKLLAAVKTEWTKYGDVLDQVQRKLHVASETIEKARVRSRAVEKRLRNVQELPSNESALLLQDLAEEAEIEDEDMNSVDDIQLNLAEKLVQARKPGMK
jgi:DNA recombination protein RmuC